MDRYGQNIVRMRVWLLSTLTKNEAYGPPESEGEIDSDNQSFLYLAMQVL